MSGPVFRTRLTERGGHVEVTVFVAVSDEATGANCGALTMQADEAKTFELVHASHRGVVEELDRFLDQIEGAELDLDDPDDVVLITVDKRQLSNVSAALAATKGHKS